MRILVFLIFGITLSGCSAMMLGGNSGGASAVPNDRSARSQASSSEVSDRVMAKYAADPVIGKFGVDVRASGGMVTLTGTVPSYAVRESAEKLAMATDGVKAVDNQISVEYRK